jgi:predicted MPP superfamily phosphohydrolase
MINKPYKFKRSEYDEILFCSDTHYNHDPKWEIPLWLRRGFSSAKEHDEWLKSEFSKVSDNSIIFHLGDAALNSTPEKMLDFFNETSAKIFYIFGNHFSPDYALYRSALNAWKFDSGLIDDNGLDVSSSLEYEIFPFTINRFVEKNIGQRKIKGIKPDFFVNGDPGMPHKDSKYCLTYLGIQCNIQIDKNLFQLSHMAPKIWYYMGDGGMALTGHSHGSCKGINPFDNEGKVLDCGIENSILYNKKAFFTFEEVLAIMKKKDRLTVDHH